MAGSYLGDVRAMSFDIVPAGWAPCKGSFCRSRGTSLWFNLLEMTYGGDGETNFALPNVAPIDSEARQLTVCISLFGATPVGG